MFISAYDYSQEKIKEHQRQAEKHRLIRSASHPSALSIRVIHWIGDTLIILGQKLKRVRRSAYQVPEIAIRS